MIINREFFFRGWLPAGLVINARLLTDTPESTALPVLKPIINPYPGNGWPTHQPSPVFPIDQATAETAIVLADPLAEGTVVMTIFPEWMGAGSPFILAVNTWYEGRIRSISGSDVMGVRLMPSASEDYYSYYSAESVKDIRVYNMPCRHILGRNTDQVMLGDPDGISVDLGMPPTVTFDGAPMAAQLADVLHLTSVSFAGMLSAYSDTNPGTETKVIQCSIEGGRRPGDPIKKVALACAPKVGRQKFFTIADGMLINQNVDVIRQAGDLITLSRSKSLVGTEQVVHYN